MDSQRKGGDSHGIQQTEDSSKEREEVIVCCRLPDVFRSGKLAVQEVPDSYVARRKPRSEFVLREIFLFGGGIIIASLSR